jgi:hypothetical protein
MSGAADVHHPIADTSLSEAVDVMHDATALDTAGHVLKAHAPVGDAPMRAFWGAAQGPAPRLPGWHDDLYLVACEHQDAQLLNRRLPAGKGDGVASAIRFSWVLPAEVSLKKRLVRVALISSTFLTMWHVCLPRSQRVCSAGSCGRPRRRSVPSWPTGGRRVARLGAVVPPRT